jgi:hypothetical protein
MTTQLLPDGSIPLPDDINNEGCLPERPTVFTTLGLDALWRLRAEAQHEIDTARDYKTAIDAELSRRFREAHPDYDAESGGTVELAGERVVLKLGYSRTYEYDDKALLQLVADELITQSEFDELVTAWQAKVDGRFFNSLLRRGEALKDRLLGTRKVKGTPSPQFEAKERSV